LKVELLMATPQEQISESAKVCYGTKLIRDGGKDITSTLVHEHKHLASLRFAYATVAIEGVSVACQNQIVRSKHLDFMVQSKRYVNASKGGFEFIMPKGLTRKQQDMMMTAWIYSKSMYEDLIESGVKKEDARAVLPANTSTKLNVTGNLQGWWSFFTLRLNSHAQSEIRELAEKIFDLLQLEYPLVFTEDVRTRLRN